MQKKMVLFIILIISLLYVSNVSSQEINEEVYADIGDVEIKEEAGLTPDDTFYFVDKLIEDVFVGDNPEKALRYKEEKIIEFKQMIEEGKLEEAKEAYERAGKYSEILEKEVSPDIEKETRESSKAIKEVLSELENDVDEEEIKILIREHNEVEDKIAVAAKISTQIKKLCESLSKLDPLEYERTCKTNNDSPKWHRNLDKGLTDEQEKEAREFFEIMSQCFQNPAECQCNKVKITSFAEQCSIIAPLAAQCMEGNEDACEKMQDIEDPIDLLPDYLQDVLEEIESKYGDSKHDLYVPKECREANALDRESCMKVMFRLNAPDECVEALDQGKLDLNNEKETRILCEKIMFEQHAPQECIDAGITTPKECGKFMFKQNAPQECIDAGLTGDSRKDEKECRKIMEQLRKNEEGFRGGFNMDCRRIQNPEERLKCYDSALEHAGERYEKTESYENWPEPCKRENAFTPESCKEVMNKFSEENRESYEKDYEPSYDYKGEEPAVYTEPSDGVLDYGEEGKEESLQGQETVIEGTHEEDTNSETTSTTEQSSEPSQEESTSSSSETTSETSSEPSESITGGFIFIDNKFLDYYF